MPTNQTPPSSANTSLMFSENYSGPERPCQSCKEPTTGTLVFNGSDLIPCCMACTLYAMKEAFNAK